MHIDWFKSFETQFDLFWWTINFKHTKREDVTQKLDGSLKGNCSYCPSKKLHNNPEMVSVASKWQTVKKWLIFLRFANQSVHYEQSQYFNFLFMSSFCNVTVPKLVLPVINNIFLYSKKLVKTEVPFQGNSCCVGDSDAWSMCVISPMVWQDMKSKRGF